MEVKDIDIVGFPYKDQLMMIPALVCIGPNLQGTDIRDAINPIRELSAYPSLKSYSLRIR